jgi:hypothetical protein
MATQQPDESLQFAGSDKHKIGASCLKDGTRPALLLRRELAFSNGLGNAVWQRRAQEVKVSL